MPRPHIEVADIFHAHGADWRKANAGHVSLAQLKVMSAVETCRTAALGGHVERCEDCGHTRISYNSCGNRHCPKCQAAVARRWLEDRDAELLPVAYFHVVFTVPAAIAAIAFQNKAAVYDLLFKTAAETLATIGADPKHLGARIGLTAVLHTWGSALTHHPHVHIIVPGGGLSPDGSRWIACKPGFFLPVRVLSRLFRRLFLSRYTHRVAISNSRLVALDDKGVTFKWKDYRIKEGDRLKTMTLDAAEFIRRFLMHVLPTGFHRIRHYGLFASAVRACNIERVRALLAGAEASPQQQPKPDGGADPVDGAHKCPCCGGRMIIIETFEGMRHARPASPCRIRIDTS